MLKSLLSKLVIATMFLGLLGYGALILSRSTTFMITGDIVAQVSTNAPVIALTFDDGPTPNHLDDVLRTLASENIPATFYLVGHDVANNPTLVRQIADAGHEIGNHSYDHQRMILKSPAFIAQQIEDTDAAIRAAGYTGPLTFRPPFGKKLVMLPLYLNRENRAAIMWDVAPDDDPHLRDYPDAYAAHVIENAENGSIILMHIMFNGNATQRAALPTIIRALKARGFEFVTVSDLLSHQTAPNRP